MPVKEELLLKLLFLINALARASFGQTVIQRTGRHSRRRHQPAWRSQVVAVSASALRIRGQAPAVVKWTGVKLPSAEAKAVSSRVRSKKIRCSRPAEAVAHVR